MTVGIPGDMRRTAFVSLVGHLALLAALTAVPVFKVSSPGPSSYQVTLVAPAPRPAPSPAPAAPAKPEPPPKPTERVHAPSVKAPAPAPPPAARVTVPPSAKPVPIAPPIPSKPAERLTDSLKETLQKVTVPKEVPLTTSPTSAVKPSLNSPAARSDAQPSKSASQTDVNEMLRHADESLRKPPVAAKPAVAVPPPATAPKMSEDINKLLSALPPPATVPPLTSPEGKTRQSKAEPPAPVRAAAGPPTASRAATVKRCPPKAEKYCPILEAAINRAWNADTNPAVRQALESAGDSTALVRIVIQPNGEIREIRINTSSGNEPYDRAVQSVLREIKSLPPLPEEMKGEPFVAVTTFTYAKKQDS